MMKMHQFSFGMTFLTEGGKWRVTDRGTRTIIAIKLDEEDESWYNGPPYAVLEHVMDEYDQDGCFLDEADYEKQMGEKFDPDSV